MKFRAKIQWSGLIGLVFISCVLELNAVSVLCLLTTATPLKSSGSEKEGEFPKDSTVSTTETYSTVVSPEQDSTVVSPEQDSTEVSPEQDSTVVKSGQDPTVVSPEQDSTVVTAGQDSTVVSPEHDSTVVTAGQDSTVVPAVNVTTDHGNNATVVSLRNDATVDSSENEITNFSTGNKTTGAKRVKRKDEDDEDPEEEETSGEPDIERGEGESEETTEDEDYNEATDGGDHTDEVSNENKIAQHAGNLQFLNSVTLISWAQSSSTELPLVKFLTVGAVVASNAIVCVPSARVPVKENDVSNWYAHSVHIAEPQSTIEKKDLVLIFHPEFRMSRDSSNRIALIMVKTEVFKKMHIPKLVALPFLPSFERTRHDDNALANCKLVVVNDNEDGVEHIHFSAMPCRYRKKAKKAYKEKVCGLPKMMMDQRPAMVRKNSFPRDLGSPLFCGMFLVGVYAGVQNIDGDRDKDDQARQRNIGRVNLAPDEQYAFDVPGAPGNYKFLSGFVNETTRKMRWIPKLDVSETNECVSQDEEQQLHDKDKERESSETPPTDEPDEGGGVDGDYTYEEGDEEEGDGGAHRKLVP